MKIQQFAVLAAFVTTLVVSTDPARANNPNNTWRDCVTVNGPGKYVVTPGFWTQNGVVIGQTWIGGGSVQGPAGTACSNVRFPNGVVPNDFHFQGDQFLSPNGTVTIISGDFYWGFPSPLLDIPLFGGQSPTTSLSLLLDWTLNPSDPFMHLTGSGGILYSGPYS